MSASQSAIGTPEPPTRPRAQRPATPAGESAPSSPLAPPGPGARSGLRSQLARCSGPGSRGAVSAAPGPENPRRLPGCGRCAGAFPLLAGARLRHRAPLPQPGAAAANPRRTHFPAGSGGVEKDSGGCNLLRLLRPGPRGCGGGGARSGLGAAPAANVLRHPARAAYPPGTRSEPAPGARARGREGARAQSWGRARAACASARLGAGLPPRRGGGGPAGRVPFEPRPLRPGSGRAGETCPLRAFPGSRRRAAEVRFNSTGMYPATWMFGPT